MMLAWVDATDRSECELGAVCVRVVRFGTAWRWEIVATTVAFDRAVLANSGMSFSLDMQAGKASAEAGLSRLFGDVACVLVPTSPVAVATTKHEA